MKLRLVVFRRFEVTDYGAEDSSLTRPSAFFELNYSISEHGAPPRAFFFARVSKHVWRLFFLVVLIVRHNLRPVRQKKSGLGATRTPELRCVKAHCKLKHGL